MNIESNWQGWKQVSLWKLRELVFECCYASLTKFIFVHGLFVSPGTLSYSRPYLSLCSGTQSVQQATTSVRCPTGSQTSIWPSHLGYIALLFVSRWEFWGSMDLAYHCCTSWPVSLWCCSSSLLKNYQSNHVFWFDWLHGIRVDWRIEWICCVLLMRCGHVSQHSSQPRFWADKYNLLWGARRRWSLHEFRKICDISTHFL